MKYKIINHISFSNICKRISFCFMLIFILFSFSGCYFFPKEEQALAPPLIESTKVVYSTIDAKKGNIVNKITGTGNFVSVAQQDIFFKYHGGYLKAVYVKAGDTVKKGDLIAELDTDSLENQIKQQEILLKKAQMEYEYAKVCDTKYEQEQKSLSAELEKLKLDEFRQEFEKSKLTAPISGKIVYMNDFGPGDYIDAYKNIARVADPGQLRVKYSNDNVSNFRLGVKVDVTLNNKSYTGEVIMTPDNAPKDIKDDLKKSVIIKVNDLPGNIKIGDSCNINLILQKKDNVIVLPKNAVKSFNGRNYVQVLDNNMKYEKDVELGIQTATEVEIVKGINEGEKIISK